MFTVTVTVTNDIEFPIFYIHFQKKVQANEFVTLAVVQEAINILRGAVTIVYPMGLPPHDPIRCEFENTEDLSGTQVSCMIKTNGIYRVNSTMNLHKNFFVPKSVLKNVIVLFVKI